MSRSEQSNKLNLLQRFTKLGLKNKATFLAIAIGTIPVIAIGTFSFITIGNDLTEKALQASKNKTLQLSDKINRFMFERYGDIQVLGSFDLFTDPSLRATITQKSASLERFIEIYGVYNNITAINLDGTIQFANTKSDTPKDFNFKDEKIDYFLDVSKTNLPVIGYPRFSEITGKFSLFAAAPIKINGKTDSIIRTRIPIAKLNNILTDFTTNEDQYYIADAKGNFFSSSNADASGKVAKEYFPNLEQTPPANEPNAFIANAENEEKIIGNVKSTTLEGLPNLGWTIVLATPTRVALAAQRNLLLSIIVGTGITSVIVAVLAIWLAGKATKPIEDAAEAVEKIGKGQLDTRLEVAGEDELAVLGKNINLMTAQLEVLQKEQEQEVQRIETARQEARQAAEFATQEQRQQKEFLQKRALELLIEVDPISQGDLTVRAKVTEDEIGTVADSYNSTVGSLRRIVAQVQTAANLMTDTTISSESSVLDLSKEALRQSEEIALALDRIQEMSQSTRTVTASAQAAEGLVRQSTITLKEGDNAMNLTVDGILAIRSTVAETSKKVKRLGESSQKISKVVNLISSFAEQTNLLALNAAIEAARAGEEGRGFSVVADRVRSLAKQSTNASREIEVLIAEIQSETNEVVTAMEVGTEQVVIGTRLVEDARQNLNKIAEASLQINTLIAAIAQSSLAQFKASEIVTDTITDVAAIALSTSTEASRVSNTFKDLLQVAQELQKSVGQFKVK